jgi:hypothetical protein
VTAPTTQAVDLANPFWAAIEHYVTDGTDWRGGRQVDSYGSMLGRRAPDLNRHEASSRYSWSIPDPASLAFVAEHSAGRLVDPLAGTGYWLRLLSDLGVDCVGYDLNPPGEAENRYHKAGVQWFKVMRADAVDAVTVHGGRTLLLSWPPYDSPLGADVLDAYTGDRVIYIGEMEGGCCGDDALFARLAEQWREVAEFRPVQWCGINDWVTVYVRQGATR